MKRASSQSGVALLEVLITAIVLAIGLMGMAALQMRSVQFNHAAYLRSQANVLAADMADRLRLDPVNARAGSYDITYGASSTGSSFIATERADWLATLASALPGGQGQVTCTATLCRISVHWKESAQANNDTYVEFVYETKI